MGRTGLDRGRDFGDGRFVAVHFGRCYIFFSFFFFFFSFYIALLEG